MDFKQICFMGLGYIGLPTAAISASKRLKVLGVDINSKVVETINKGKIHIIEPCLGELVNKLSKVEILGPQLSLKSVMFF